MSAHYPEGTAHDSRAPWNRPSCTQCGSDAQIGEDLCEACRDLDPEEEKVPVVVAVHNGIVRDGRPMFVQYHYLVPTSVLDTVQKALADHQVGWSS